VGAACAKLFNYNDILERVFGRIIEKGDLEKIIDNIIYGVNKSKAKPIAFILFIFKKCLANSSNALDKKLGDIAEKYFEKLSSGERKRTFSELLTLAEQEEIKQFEHYFEEFNAKHKSGFFDFLKGKK